MWKMTLADPPPPPPIMEFSIIFLTLPFHTCLVTFALLESKISYIIFKVSASKSVYFYKSSYSLKAYRFACAHFILKTVSIVSS